MATPATKENGTRQVLQTYFDRFFEIGDPFADLFGLRRTMNALADSVLRPGTFNELGAPAMDLYRKDGTYVIEYALPGLDKKDIDIEVESNCLTVSGKYSKEEADEDKRYHYRRELRRGSFSRSIAFPEEIDPNKVSANFEKGILKIELQSLRPAEVKKVAIK